MEAANSGGSAVDSASSGGSAAEAATSGGTGADSWTGEASGADSWTGEASGADLWTGEASEVQCAAHTHKIVTAITGSTDMMSGFVSPYFIVPKKSGGLRPVLDLRVLIRALHKLPFKMLTLKRST